jgi:hypothetical protein
MSPAYCATIWIEHRAWRRVGRASRPAAGAASQKRPLGVLSAWKSPRLFGTPDQFIKLRNTDMFARPDGASYRARCWGPRGSRTTCAETPRMDPSSSIPSRITIRHTGEMKLAGSAAHVAFCGLRPSRRLCKWVGRRTGVVDGHADRESSDRTTVAHAL